jgi:hypothetical protein
MPASNKNITVSFRTREDTKGLLDTIAEDFGGNATAALEFIIRDYAKRKGIKRKSSPPTDPNRAGNGGQGAGQQEGGQSEG